MKNKRLLFLIGIVLLIVGAIILIVVIKDDKKDNKEEDKTNPYRHEMLVSINPVVKLVFDIDPECKESPEICLISSSKVVSYELINDNAKIVYKDLDFKEKSVYDSLVLMCDVAKENEIDVKKLTLTSSFLVNTYDLKNYIKNTSTKGLELEIVYDERDVATIDDYLTTTVTTTKEKVTSASVKVSKKTTEDPHKNMINLNDTVKVVVHEPCGVYIKINDLCTNMSIAQLKEKFPSQKGRIDEMVKKVGASESDDVSKLYKKLPLTYKEALVSCGLSSIVVNKYGGVYTSNSDSGMQLHYLTTSNNTYKKYFEYSSLEADFNKKNVYYEARCGGETEETVTLSEELCEQYNLKCDRW